MRFSEKVYFLCQQIPKGKVSTYKEIAKKLGTKAYRVIGQVLKQNQSIPKIPCHRVVKSNGKLGGYFGSNPKNIEKKIKILKSEGIIVKEGKIDLNKYKFNFDTKNI